MTSPSQSCRFRPTGTYRCVQERRQSPLVRASWTTTVRPFLPRGDDTTVHDNQPSPHVLSMVDCQRHTVSCKKGVLNFSSEKSTCSSWGRDFFPVERLAPMMTSGSLFSFSLAGDGDGAGSQPCRKDDECQKNRSNSLKHSTIPLGSRCFAGWRRRNNFARVKPTSTIVSNSGNHFEGLNPTGQWRIALSSLLCDLADLREPFSSS